MSRKRDSIRRGGQDSKFKIKIAGAGLCVCPALRFSFTLLWWEGKTVKTTQCKYIFMIENSRLNRCIVLNVVAGFMPACRRG